MTFKLCNINECLNYKNVNFWDIKGNLYNLIFLESYIYKILVLDVVIHFFHEGGNIHVRNRYKKRKKIYQGSFDDFFLLF